MGLNALRSSAGALVRFRGELAHQRKPIAAAFLASLGYAAMRLAEPWPLKVVFDNVLSGMPLQTHIGPLDRLLA